MKFTDPLLDEAHHHSMWVARIREYSLKFHCSICGAQVDKPCRTKAGTQSGVEHLKRLRAAIKALRKIDNDLKCVN